MIEVRASKRLGEFTLDAEMGDGGFICLWGPNGAGKTTLLNVIAGLLRPDAGSVRINARDVTGEPIERRGIVMVKQDSCLPHLGVEDHLTWGARTKKLKVDGSYVNEVRNALGVTFSGRVGSLSLGMRERVSLATALIAKPGAVLVDEVFSNISDRAEFVGAYRDLCRAAAVDVVFTGQSSETGKSADHSYRIEAGRTTRLF